MFRVLVTRPRPGADATAGRLAALGYAPVVMPLTEIVGLAPSLPSEAATADAVVATSANALRHADDSLIRMLAGKPCLAVGAATAALARSRGFSNVIDGPGDAEGLAPLVAAATRAGSTLVYLCGSNRRDTLEAEIARSGRRVLAVETYATRDLDPAPEAVAGMTGSEPIDAALLYSAHAAERLSVLERSKAMGRCLSNAMHVCISQRTAEGLTGAMALRIAVAATPDEDAMLAALGDAANRAAT